MSRAFAGERALAERPDGTMFDRVQAIVTAADSSRAADSSQRERLLTALRAAGYIVDELGESAMELRQRLDATGSSRSGATVLVTGPGWDRAEQVARIALERGMPVMVWPEPPGAGRRARVSAHDVGRTIGTSARLTDREREVLEGVAAGISNKGIARRLGLSPNTVKYHITALFAKLGASTRAEAVAAAVRRGELSL